MPQSIIVWNRSQKQEEIEQVYGEKAVQWIYETRIGQRIADAFLSRPGLSQIYGAFQSSRLSAHHIQPFIDQFQIPMEEFEPGPYLNFNDFFIRKFKEGKRSFTQAPHELAAFSEARYLAYEKVLPDQTFPVKGKWLSASALLGSVRKAKPFEGGPLLLARLCPTDYHRFHFPDDGRILETYSVSGKLHSVNPMALKYRGDIFITNERQVSVLETKNFGRLAYIEVGALCVGKIVQTHLENEFKRGDEKGYFLFGGSTVIVLGEPGKWVPDSDIVKQTKQGRETLIRLGERVGVRVS